MAVKLYLKYIDDTFLWSIVLSYEHDLKKIYNWIWLFWLSGRKMVLFKSSNLDWFLEYQFTLNRLYKFSILLLTSWSDTNRLWPPGTCFIMCRSIFSFSRIATPVSIKIGGWDASKFVRKSAGGLFMSTVVIFKEIVLSSANRYKSIKYSWQNMQAPFRLPSIVDAWK